MCNNIIKRAEKKFSCMIPGNHIEFIIFVNFTFYFNNYYNSLHKAKGFVENYKLINHQQSKQATAEKNSYHYFNTL